MMVMVAAFFLMLCGGCLVDMGLSSLLNQGTSSYASYRGEADQRTHVGWIVFGSIAALLGVIRFALGMWRS